EAGALGRRNEANLLPKLDRISSVSGGSITAGVLALHWGHLDFDPGTGVAAQLVPKVIEPIRRLAGKTVDVGSILGGLLSPFSTIGDKVADAYRKHLFG